MGRPKGSKNGIRQLIDKSCEICGAFFQVDPYRVNARFCSRPCQAVGHAREMFHQEERRCRYCGSSFMARPASDKIYCSAQCASKEHPAKVRKPHKATEFVTSACPACGKFFTAHAVLQQTYCSRACGSKSYERRIELECQVCHKIYSVRAKFSDQKYCSRTCRTIGIGKTESYLERKFASGLSLTKLSVVPQYPIGPYTVDFALPKLKIVIECDGDYWHSRPDCIARDRRKDAFLTNKGWLVLRFSETAINTDLTGCLAQIVRLASL